MQKEFNLYITQSPADTAFSSFSYEARLDDNALPPRALDTLSLLFL